MAVERKDRVKDQTATTGTGTITIDLVAPTGYRNFSAHTTGVTVNYLIIDATGLNWEVGSGVWTSGTQTLTRPSANVVASSAGAGVNVSFGAGLKTVATLPTTSDFKKGYFNSGTTNALDYENGEWQRWAPSSGSQTLSITGFPSSEWATMTIEGVNLGTPTITWPTSFNWMNPDGTFTTSFTTYKNNTGVALKTSGVDFLQLMTRDGGTTIYARVVR